MNKEQLRLIYHRLVDFQDYLDHTCVDDTNIAYELNSLSKKVGEVYDFIVEAIFD